MRHACLAAASLALVLVPTSLAQLTPNPNKPLFLPVNIPTTDDDPIVDGRATSNPEWSDAMRVPDSFFFGNAGRSGFYSFERREDWTASPVGPPVEGGGITYDGSTLFVAHDIVGSPDPDNPLHQFQVDDPHDWNSFDFPVEAGTARIWVFDGENDDDDSNWLPFADDLATSHLIREGDDPDLIDDRGFIARLNGDPMTDVHWFEGMPEPGDPGWDWADWHFVFGRHTFGQSFQDVLLDTDTENRVDHEVYEACSYRPDFDMPPPPPPWCLWWSFVTVDEVEVKDVLVMKDGTPTKAKVKVTTKKKVPILTGQWWLHWWDPGLFPVGVPPTFNWIFLIGSQYTDLIEANSKGVSDKKVQDAFNAQSFLIGFLFALDSGDSKQAFQLLAHGRKYMGRAEKGKNSFESLAFAQVRMRIVALAYYIVVSQIIAADAGLLFPIEGAGGTTGLPMDDKDLVKSSKGLYRFGKALQKFADKGTQGQGKVLNSLNALKKVTKSIEKMNAKLADG